MSKSVGNVLSAASLLNQAPPAVLRYALTAGHYRSMIEWTSPSQATTSAITSSNSQTEENDDADTLAVAQAAWDRLSGFVERSSGRFGRTPTAELNHTPLPPAFVEAMDDDLSTPSALAVIHETVRRGNTALAEYDDQVASQALTQARAMLAVLGLDPLDPHWCSQSANDNATQTALAALIEAQLTERAAARTARDFATADTIRDNLAAAGVIIEDSPEGSRWSLN
jgi:cysteinyl-tRNA synthetase